MSHAANNKKHNEPQPEEGSLVYKTCLHDNPPIDFAISMGMLPFLNISDTCNMDLVSCEVSTSNSCENVEQLKENAHWEDLTMF